MTTILVTGNYVVGPDQNLIFDGSSSPVYTLDTSSAIQNSSGSDPNFTDQGLVRIASSQANASIVALTNNAFGRYSGPLVKITPNGSLTVDALGANSTAYGYYSGFAPVEIENDGAFKISATNTAIGASMYQGGYIAAAPIFQNTGDFTVSGSSAVGIQGGYPATYNNSGTITVSGVARAVALDLGLVKTASAIDNSGVITATTQVGGQSWAILAYGVSSISTYTPLVITNSGTITAQKILAAGGDGSIGSGPSDVQLTNSGILNGQIWLDAELSANPRPAYDNQIHNTGAINGAVHLSHAGNDLYDGRGGTLTGGVYTSNVGASVDVVYLGNDGETVHCSGGGFADVTMGSGLDTIVVDKINGPFTAFHPIVITGFQAGAGGDKLDLSAYASTYSQVLADLALGSPPTYTTVFYVGPAAIELIGVPLSGLTPDNFVLAPATTQTATPGANTALVGGLNNDTLIGATGANDTFQGGGGVNSLSGGVGGINTAVYTSLSRSYSLTIPATSATILSGGLEGASDTLTNIQRIQFADGYLATSTTDTAGQVYRLYEGTLGRAPDPAGLANWVSLLNSGTDTLQQVTDGFVGSTEFQTSYGALSNTAFVTLLYNNVLHRAPDTLDLANWVGLLNSGTDTRSQVVLGFTQSQEDIADSTPAIQQGLWIQDLAAAQVARLYDTVLGRLPDQQGEINWTHLLDSGADTLMQVAQGFTGSQEFMGVYGHLSNTDFVTDLYLNSLHRAPDTAGLHNWVSLLNAGTDTRAQVVLGFSESVEHIKNTAAQVDNGIWFA